MQKPVPYTPPPAPAPTERYDYHEIMEFVENKYGFDARDFHGAHGHFDKWCDAKGYGKKDPVGKDRGSSQIWFKEYQEDPQGEAVCPPYSDFWHWLLDASGGEIYNGCEITMYVGDWLEEADDPTSFYKLAKPEYQFVVQILKYLQAEFGDEFDVDIEW